MWKCAWFSGILLLFGMSACMGLGTDTPTPILSPTPPAAVVSVPTMTADMTDEIPATPTATMTLMPTASPFPTPTRAYRYVFPVSPNNQLVDYVDGHAGYPATDIFAPEGYAFLAVTDGVVDYVCPEDRWDPATDDPAVRGGISVAIIGDDGVRYYGSHLLKVMDGLSTGKRVTAGQVLGLVGKTGNARDTLTHVHFAISAPTYPEDWKTRRGQVNPYPYLLAWQNGENLTPRLP